MEEFRAGDVVQLKSGGFLMTVESIDEEGLNCIWFANEELKAHYFMQPSIKKYDENIE